MKSITLWSIISVLGGTAWALPPQFTCKPTNYYSGGFDIYTVKRVLTEENEEYQGIQYWQETTDQGLLVGSPVLMQTIPLTTTQINTQLILDGFVSGNERVDSLSLPLDWNGDAIAVESRLFYNDVPSDGVCRSDIESKN